MSEATQAPANTDDNAVIRELRQQIKDLSRDVTEANKKAERLEAVEQERDQLKAAATEAERAKMDEVERLKAELDELKPYKDQAGALSQRVEAFESRAEAEYGSILQGVPEEFRESVERLSATGSWVERADLARHAATLLPQPQPQKAGTVTNPADNGGGMTPPTDGSKVKPDQPSSPPKNWRQAFPNLESTLANSRTSMFDKSGE